MLINYKDTNKILFLTLIILLFIILIISTIILVSISNLKNKKNLILKNLEYCQNINLKDRLKRISKIIKTNIQYENIFNIWINRYLKLLTQDCQNIVKKYWKIIDLENKRDYITRNELIKKTYVESERLKNLTKKLLVEIDYFISIDQLIREYQLFFKQNFNYLQAEIIKTNLQNEINQEQLTEIINILENKFNDLENHVNQAQFSLVINSLSEIAVGITVLAEILINLPSLSHQVYHLIPARINLIKKQLEQQSYNHNLLINFNALEESVNKKLLLTQKLINNLQYKKSKNEIKEILYFLNKFNADLKEEYNFNKIFFNYYNQFLNLSLNFNQVFENINQNFEKINQTQKNNEIDDIFNVIKQQITKINNIESEITIEVEKENKNLTYQQLLMLLRDLLESNILTFNSLENYNKLLTETIKVKININTAINKLNSIMVQIENIISNQKYKFLIPFYQKIFFDLENKIKKITNTIENSIELDLNIFIKELNLLQNQSFQLFQQIKITIIFHQLSNEVLIYANRYRQMFLDNEQVNLQFQKIEENLKAQNYQQALINLISLIQ